MNVNIPNLRLFFPEKNKQRPFFPPALKTWQQGSPVSFEMPGDGLPGYPR
jgi:hypothetical protein